MSLLKWITWAFAPIVQVFTGYFSPTRTFGESTLFGDTEYEEQGE